MSEETDDNAENPRGMNLPEALEVDAWRILRAGLEKIHHAHCCGCNLQIDVNGQVLRGDADGDFSNMRKCAKP